MVLPVASVLAEQPPSRWVQKIGDQSAYGKGFGLNTNIATRGMAIYRNELYIGTENLNKAKLKDILGNIAYQVVSAQVAENAQQAMSEGGKGCLGQTGKLIQGGANSQYVYQIPGYYWDEDYEGYTYSPDGVNQYILEPETFCLPGLRGLVVFTKLMRFALHVRSFCSDGGEIWKYNYTTDSWTHIIGSQSVTGIQAGFDYSFNCAISVLKEFKGYLYAGTWSTPLGSLSNPDRKGCEIWRYNGTTWEQVVGRHAYQYHGWQNGGFGNPDNVAAWSIEEFNGYLYVGTMNWNLSETGACEIWRSNNGIQWTKVVDHGFRSNMSANDPDDIANGVVNTYAWIMKNFSGKLYVGTFNSRGSLGSNLQGAGAQLWKSSNGVSWIKEPLPNGTQNDFKNGFGEWQNYGIRRMEIYDNALYLGIATHLASSTEGCEIWRYNGSGGRRGWTCIVGEAAPVGEYCMDGFNNTANKYVWSMAVTADGLYAGTAKNGGCQVYKYKVTSGWHQLVGNSTHAQEPDGFGDPLNFGARSMIKYPSNTEIVFLGTFTHYVHVPDVGCEVWMRYP